MMGSPTRLREAGDFAGMGHLAQAQAAEAELAVNRARAATFLAARIAAHLELGRCRRLVNE